MAAGNWTMFRRAKYKMMAGGVTFSGGAFRAHLFVSAGSLLSAGLDVSTIASLSNQMTATRGYATSGVVVSNVAFGFSTNNVVMSADGFCWSASGGNLGSTDKTRQVMIALSAGIPIGFADLSTAGFAVSAGSALRINGGAGSSGRLFELA